MSRVTRISESCYRSSTSYSSNCYNTQQPSRQPYSSSYPRYKNKGCGYFLIGRISNHERQKLGYLSVNTFQMEHPPPSTTTTTHHQLSPIIIHRPPSTYHPTPLDRVGVGAGNLRTAIHYSSPLWRQLVANVLRCRGPIFPVQTNYVAA